VIEKTEKKNIALFVGTEQCKILLFHPVDVIGKSFGWFVEMLWVPPRDLLPDI